MRQDSNCTELQARRFEEWGPHLWAIWKTGNRPSLCAFIGEVRLKLLRLPDEVIREWQQSENPSMDSIESIGAFIRNWRAGGGRHIHDFMVIGYEFRATIDSAYRFDIGGLQVSDEVSWLPAAQSWISIGGQKLATTEKSFFESLSPSDNTATP
jgi:hypothetical protein